MLKPWRFAILEDRRERLGITQVELARAAGKTVGWYNLVQRWKREPKWTDILAMAARVGVNLDSLRSQLSKAPPVAQNEVDRELERIGPRKKRGGVARIRKVAEDEGRYRPRRKR